MDQRRSITDKANAVVPEDVVRDQGHSNTMQHDGTSAIESEQFDDQTNDEPTDGELAVNRTDEDTANAALDKRSGKTNPKRELQKASPHANVVLVGATASGKSTVGWLLARLIGYGFIDLDHIIEAREQKSIAQIFEERGEHEFRRMEKELVQSLAHIRNHVIATGAGAVVDDDSWEIFQGLGTIVWLNTPPEEIARRLLKDEAELRKRPLLADLSNVDLQQRHKLLAERLSALIGNRVERYKQAKLVMIEAFATSESSARLLKDMLVRNGYLSLTLDERPFDRWRIL